MKNKIILIMMMAVMLSTEIIAQDTANKKPLFSISGTAGVSYEYYGLSKKPVGWTGFSPRKPWNQVRFNFSPNMQFGKNFSLPFNFNFAMSLPILPGLIAISPIKVLASSSPTR
jgi:hypothetical protein